MANINKIRLSGTTYNIEDANASKTVELTQAQYDALVTVDPNTFYIITDATAGDLSNYYTKSETSGATEISTALATKQDTLVSGTNIKTINNESILGSGNITIEGGGGSSYQAGTNISIDNDTINCTLPISAGTNALGVVANAIKMGENTTASSVCSFAMGTSTLANGYRSFAGGVSSRAKAESTFAYGTYVDSLQFCETAFGIYNASNKANSTFGDSGNTLFSVGNGTTNNARHNAFEIRQNGDIYIADTNDTSTSNFYEKPMIKLQDALGGGGGIDSGTVQTMIDNSLSGYVYTADNGKQDIYGSKTFIGEKRISFTQGTSSNKPGFTIYGVRDAEGNASQLGTFELNPTAITESNTTFPLLSLGHYRSGNRRASVQSYIGFRQYDYDNSAAYHLLAPLPQNAKTPFSLTTNFQNFYMPLGIKVDNSTMVKADSGGVIDISSYIGSITIDPSLDSGSTNAVANSAITNALNAKSDKGNFNNFMFTSMNGNPGALFKKDNGDSKTLWFSKINGTKVFEISSIEQAPNFSLVETSAITTSVTSSSTDSQVPSAKAVYDIVGNIETLLSQI